MGDGVRLRQRSSHRRSADSGRVEGTGARDRYSAPPMDRQFPPHSCTSATYEHGCRGTSRITLRLSKNGSTLEIEKCDFQHDRSSCQRCGPGETVSQDSDLLTPLRTQSAPNLSFVTIHHGANPPPRPPRHTRVDSGSQPPPLPPRQREVLVVPTASAESVGSPPGSVRTATRVDVEVESIRSSRQSSATSTSQGTASFHAHKDPLLGREPASPDRVGGYALSINGPHGLLDGLVSVHSENIPGENAGSPHCTRCHPQDPNTGPTVKTSQQAAKRELINSIPNNHIVPEVVDLTVFHVANSHIDDVDIDYLTFANHSQAVVRREKAGAQDAVCGCKDQAQAGVDDYINSLHNPNHSDLSDNIDGVSVSSAAGSSRHDSRLSTPGATDYRVLMLGAGCSEITSHLTEARRGSNDLTSTGLSLYSSQVVPGVNISRLTQDAAANGGHLTGAANGSRLMSLKAGRSRLDRHSDDSTDTGCESDDDSEKSQLLARIEMAPAYVHADFKNDFGDLFDDSSPELDTS
ncbi:uncharacterized protein [Littorina saxatilis]